MSDRRQQIADETPLDVAALARWIAAFDGAALPAQVIDQAKLLLLDSIGCAFAGRGEPVTQGVLALCAELGGSGPCTVVGQRATTDAAHATLANGVLVRVLDLNDYLIGETERGPEIGGHPSDNIPVALAVGEARRRSGRDILAAIVLAYELYDHFKRRMDRMALWDGVGVSGFVAPAIAGKLLGLDADRLAHALALGGIRAALPAVVRRGGISAAKSIANALVAQAGVEAALLAEHGVTGPLAILDSDDGLRRVFPDAASLPAPSAAGGAIMRANVKAYPCLATGQCAVAAALQLRAQRGGGDNIERLELIMADYPFIARQQRDPGRARPASREAADHSFPFLVAVALIDGRFGPDQFEHERWRDPAVMALMVRLSMRTDPSLNDRAPGSYPCVLRAVSTDGAERQVEVLYPPGHAHGGIAEAAVIEKFHTITAATLDRAHRERIIEAVLAFPSAATIDALTTTIGA
jgi:2-methylcitrate dehydratase